MKKTETEKLEKATRYLALELPDQVYNDYSPMVYAAIDRIRDLEAALQSVMENLGVPGEDYPAPVAAAYDIASEVLSGKTEDE